MQIALVDVFPSDVSRIKLELEKEHISIESFESIHDEIGCLLGRYFTVVILGDVKGIETTFKVLRNSKFVKKSGTIIIVVARNFTENEKIIALELGANVCLESTASGKLIVANINSLTRFAKIKSVLSTFQISNLKINYYGRKVTVDNEEVHLTPIEFKVLWILMNEIEDAVSKTDLTKRIWGTETFISPRNIDVHVSSLRKKLKKNACKLRICSIRNYGFRFGLD